MKCRECYVWQMRVDLTRERQVELCEGFAKVFGNEPGEEILTLLEKESNRLQSDLDILYQYRNEDCPAQRCRLGM